MEREAMRRRTMNNIYYAVIEPFTVEARVGLSDSQIYIGSSMALRTIYQTVTVRPGDEIHLLFGGDFLVRDGAAWEFHTRRHDPMEVMLHPAPFDPDLPADRLREISFEERSIPTGGYARPEFAVGAPGLKIR
jgi:hypothetical protein